MRILWLCVYFPTQVIWNMWKVITKSVVHGMVFKQYSLERKKKLGFAMSPVFLYIFLKRSFILFKLFIDFASVFEVDFLNGTICWPANTWVTKGFLKWGHSLSQIIYLKKATWKGRCLSFEFCPFLGSCFGSMLGDQFLGKKKSMCECSGLSIGNDKGFPWQSSGEICPPHTTLVHSQCTVVFEEACSQGVLLTGWSCSYTQWLPSQAPPLGKVPSYE